jgi:hypothetical protein
MKKYVILFWCIASFATAQTPIKKWSGILNAGGRKVELILQLQPDSNATYKSTWEIPAQKVKGLTSTKTELKGNA